MDPIQPKENVDDLQQNDSCVTVDEFRVLMKEAEVQLKEKLEKKKIYELIGVLDGKLMDVDNKVNKRIDTLEVKSNRRMDILQERMDIIEEKVNEIDNTCLAIRDKILGSMPPKSVDKEKHDGYARDRKSESRINESKSHSSRRRDKSVKAPEREMEREKERAEQKEKERERDQHKRDHLKGISRESHKSHERKSDKRRKHDSSISLDTTSSRKKQTEPVRDNGSRREPRVITGQAGLLPLTEIQLQALAKPDNCVKFIGKLALASYPEGYFLKKTNSFAVAVTSHQIDALYSIVSSKYKEIKRCGRPRPSQNLTKEVMTDVIRNRVNFFRSMNRHLMY
ncbi:zinc finger CCCH domain-containing protein 13-like isoform X2 [Daphnia pulex]|uniref:zinc finger CCCH domain-containing protein 13-like isoform X2 n=1 Tax=Daphnia pulex TaxID=6669 RepID=UPI001EDD770F|nr:zinc finger CCCH domain-containing protein 13-like isoform X2 [Daphnia pulex]XP_046458293.1 zinc finger CCCH domain-containing protein 13-like isoform X2 [Daphnia pulex]